MRKIFPIVFLLVASLPVCLMATPQYLDYSQFPHWSGRYFAEGDDVTSVSLCQIQGMPLLATTGLESGLSFFEAHENGLELVYSHPLPGVPQGAVFRDTDVFVIAQPNRLTKFFFYAMTNPIEIWTDQLPGSPRDIQELMEYLLLACGEDGLLVFDPTTMFNLPVGVVATLPMVAEEIIVQDNMVIVRTGQGMEILDFSDPLNPISLSSYEIGSTLAMAMIEDQIFVSSHANVIEFDISDPTYPVELRTMSLSSNQFGITAMLPTFGGLNLSAGSKMHFLDLASGEISWTMNDYAHGKEMVEFGGFLTMAAGEYGLQIYDHGPPAFAPTSEPFGPSANLRDLQIEGDFLFGYFGGKSSQGLWFGIRSSIRHRTCFICMFGH